MSELTDSNDLSGSYQSYRQSASADDLINAARARMATEDAATAAKAGVKDAAGAAEDAGVEIRPIEGGYGRFENGILMAVGANPENLKRMASGAASAGLDVLGGVVETPRQVMGGVSDAVRNALRAADAAASYLNENVVDLSLPSTGVESLDNPIKALASALPKIDKARTVTGGVVRDTSKFLAGFLPAFKALRAAGVASKAAAGVGAGGAAGATVLDPNDENLSDLIQKYPALQNPVAEFLASDPNDGEAMARLKKGIENAGFGALAEGVVLGVKAIAMARRAKITPTEATNTLEAARQQYGSMTERDFLILGDPNKPLLQTSKAQQPEALAASRRARKMGSAQIRADEGPTAQQVVGQVLAGEAGGKQVYVNFARIEGPDDVKKLIGQMADTFAEDIDKARRGVQSNKETQKLADSMGMTVGDVLNRRMGQPFNAEEALAARKLLGASAGKLMETAEKAAAPNAGKVDLYNFRKMMAIHYAIQAEVIGARTETARALQAWSIPAGGNVETARAVEMLMQGMGGPDVSIAMAKRLATLKAEGITPGALNAVIRKGAMATTMDAVKEAYVMGLLWSPTTHIVNSSSNATVAAQQIYERGVAARIGQLAGTEGGVVPGEAMAMTYGLVTGLKDAFRLSFKALRTGEQSALGKIDLGHDPAISAEAFGINNVPLGAAVDYIGHATRIPGRLLATEDEFFKSLAYRMEVHAQAFRQAASEGLTDKARALRMAELTRNPPENIRIAAADQALYATFNNQPGEWAQALMKLRNTGEFNPMFLFLPFLRTPVNIFRYGFERSPMAPLVGQWRADIAAGGARADLAIARMATGSAILAMGADYAYSGYISGAGPRDKAERDALIRQGWQPYSVYVGDKWVSYNRESTVGTMLGTVADMSEALRRADMSPEDFDDWVEISGEIMAATAKSVTDKSFMRGMANVVAAIEDPDQGIRRLLIDQTGALVPFGSAGSFVNRALDPVQRDVNDPWQAIQIRLPTMAANLTPARNLWGEERRPQGVYGPTFDVLTPAKITEPIDSPIDAEMTRLGMGVLQIPKRTSMGGVNVDMRDYPKAYDELVRLAGNELKHPAWNLGAKDYLDQVVTGKHPMSAAYNILSDGKDGGKASFIKHAIEEYRNLAKQKILDDPQYQDLRQDVDQQAAERQRAKMPVLQ